MELSPYLDQNPELSRPIKCVLLEVDRSPYYELDACVLVELENGTYAVIYVSGCSCGPSRGYTSVYEARTPEQAIKDAFKGEPYGDSVKALWGEWYEKRVLGK